MADQHLLPLAILVWGTLAASISTLLWLAFHAPPRRSAGSSPR